MFVAILKAVGVAVLIIAGSVGSGLLVAVLPHWLGAIFTVLMLVLLVAMFAQDFKKVSR